MRVPPPGRRSTTERGPEGLEISIPAKRNVFAVVFLGAWLIGWTFGETFAIYELLFGGGAERLFLLFWLVGWTVGGGFALFAWLWMIKGREVIALRPGVLVIRHDVLGVGRTREYDLQHTRNVRVAPGTFNPFDWNNALQFWGMAGGIVAFDYGARTIRVGNGIDEAEAREIVRELKTEHAFSDVA